MIEDHQKCVSCEIEKPAQDFTVDRRESNLLNRQCNPCRKQSRKITNITKTTYAKMLVAQSYKCAICKTLATELKKELAVDHNHETHVIRGLLCARCNVGLGYFRDNIKTLTAAIKYLEQTNGAA